MHGMGFMTVVGLTLLIKLRAFIFEYNMNELEYIYHIWNSIIVRLCRGHEQRHF